MPRGLPSTAGKAARYRNAPVGNGPFLLAASWDRKDAVGLVPAPGYDGSAPHIAGLTFAVVEDPAAAYAQFQAGVLWCAFNTRKAPLDDVLVRRAFSLALDRNQLSATQPIPGYLLTPATDMLSPACRGAARSVARRDSRPGAGGGAARRGRLPRRRRPARDHLPDPRQGQLLGSPRAIGVTLR